MSEDRRSNILIVSTDQHRGDCLGVAGRRVRTPHIDRLARAGTRFSACTTAGPVCQPARASLLTGLLPLSHGVRDNGIDLDERVAEDGFASRLAETGYQTAFIGKAHFSTKFTFRPTGRPECQHSSADYGEQWFGPYMGFHHVELMLGTMTEAFPPLVPPAGQHFERWFSRHRDEALELWRTRLPPDDGTPQTWNSALPVAWHPTSWVADRAIAWLRQMSRKQPFCLWASIPDPHHPFDCPFPWATLHSPDDVESPIAEPVEARSPWWHRVSQEGTPALDDPTLRAFRAAKSRMPRMSAAQERRMVSNYYGMIALADHGLGRILTELADLGLSANTVIVFLSDHGDLLGDHGLTLKGPTFFEGLMNVPLILAGPGIAAGRVITTPVSTVDLAPTLFDIAEVRPCATFDGRSLFSALKGGELAERPVFAEWRVDERRFGAALDLRMVRTAAAKLTFEYGSGVGELYDLSNDPAELRNLFGEADAAPLQRELLGLLEARPNVVREDFDAPVGMS